MHITPTATIDDLKGKDAIAGIYFGEGGERFLVRYNEQLKQLYFHAPKSEIMFYMIVKMLKGNKQPLK